MVVVMPDLGAQSMLNQKRSATPALCNARQVFELCPEADPSAVWREVSLLKCCLHPRIVPLYGVAKQVRDCCGGQFLPSTRSPVPLVGLAFPAEGCQGRGACRQLFRTICQAMP